MFQSEKREVKILIRSRLVDCGSEHRSTLRVQDIFLVPDSQDISLQMLSLLGVERPVLDELAVMQLIHAECCPRTL